MKGECVDDSDPVVFWMWKMWGRMSKARSATAVSETDFSKIQQISRLNVSKISVLEEKPLCFCSLGDSG